MNKIINQHCKDYHDYYYLLYKSRNSPTLWVVDESVYKKDFLERINNFHSEKEVYYIVSKKYSTEYINEKLESKFIRFQIFKVDSKCKLVHNTE